MNRTPPIVTITSDFGWRDYHLALIKGKLLCQTPNARIVDISHEVGHYNIVEAAFLFKHSWKAFPVGTIHLLSVNDFGEPDKPYLVFSHKGHHFIGPDNGLFSLVFTEQPAHIFAIDMSEETPSNFPIASIFAKSVGHFSQDLPAGGLGKAVDKWTERITFHPVTGPNLIRASVVYVDNFDNVILNIHQELFENIGNSRDFELFFKRHSPIKKLSTYYHEVPIGEILCRFNSARLLEIAINMDKAATLLGLKVEDTVQVDFKGG